MIGIFDSGSGGLTVLRALPERAPNCDVVYFADLANMPYGSKTQNELQSLTRTAISFLTTHGATEIISACNSVSEQVLTSLSKEIIDEGINIIEMVTPTVNALSGDISKKILLVATQATVSSDIYKHAFLQKGIQIHQIAIPPLAEAIEEGVPEEKIQTILNEYLGDATLPKLDMVILGCTQYPLIKKSFERFFADSLIFDPANAVAEEAVKRFTTEGEEKLTFFTSQESAEFNKRITDLFPTSSKHSMVMKTT